MPASAVFRLVAVLTAGGLVGLGLRQRGARPLVSLGAGLTVSALAARLGLRRS